MFRSPFFLLCYNTDMQFVFILGHNPKLSVAEILAVLPQAKPTVETGSFLILETEKFDCKKVLDQLGGTIKIGTVLDQKINKELIVNQLKELKPTGKLKFGLSYYNCPKDNLGMEIKKELKEAGISSRLVTGRDKALSSVIVTKNKVQEFLILENKWLARTCAVQEFEEYSQRDYGRPVRDVISGTMPPKLAKIMINLAQMPTAATLLDPFCGSGTILQEAALLGYEKVIGSDISEEAIKDTKENLDWLAENLKVDISKIKVSKSDVRQLSKKINQIDTVVTEPHLGPPLRGQPRRGELEKIVDELSELYVTTFSEFRKILNSGGKIVIVFPAFRAGREILELPILDQIKKLGFSQVNRDKLIYSRPGQKVWRQVFVFSVSN
jgi:tRNA G10  N-methylase Trm11